MNRLKISKPYIDELENGESRLIYDIQGEGETYPLYFQVKEKYKKYLVTELSDACLVCLLLYAMERNLDLEFETPVSERLYYQLKEYLIPAISKNIKRYSSINVICSTSDVEFDSFAVGTGLSCGVDSFYSALKNLEHDKSSKLRLTHMCFFNAGASGMFGGEEARSIYQERAERFQHVAEEMQCEFFQCDSNMNEFLHQEHAMTHVFRTLCIPLALQKLFSVYYFSSGFEYAEFKFTETSPAYYEILILPNISNQNIRFVEVGGETTRQGKVDYISNYDITYRELNVCIHEAENCNECRKCKETTLNLYLTGNLEKYKPVFDVERFEKNKHRMFRWALMNFWRTDVAEIIKNLKKRKEISFLDYVITVVVFPFDFAKQVIGKLKFIKSKGQ